jgi:hypothetical protein
MFFFSFHAVPKPGSDAAKEFAGACVNCWIEFKSHWGARMLAEMAIEDAGWSVTKLDRELETGRDFYKGDEEDFQYFEEAERDGWSFFFHRYSKDAPDKGDAV